MGYKRIFIFICFIIYLSCIAGVCAGDVNETAVDGINQELNLCNGDALSMSDMGLYGSSVENETLNLDDGDESADRQDTAIVASDLVTDYRKLDYLEATLKDTQNRSLSGAILTVSLNGINNYTSDSNGNIKVPTYDLNAGVYDASINFAGDENHTQSSKTVKITVNKINSILEGVIDRFLDYGTVMNITVGIDGASGIAAEIDGKDVGVDGLKIQIPKMDAGTHTLTVATLPDANHNAVNKTARITVRKADSTLTVNDIAYNYGGFSKVKLYSNGAEGFIAKIDGNDVSIDGNEILISGLDAGNHTLTVSTRPDANHNSVTRTAKVTVRKVNSSVGLKDFELNYGSSSTIKLNTEGVIELSAEIDGSDVNVNGNLIIIPKLDAGTHMLIVTTVPDDNHISVTRTANITVLKADSKITVSNTTLTYGTSLNMTVNTEGATEFTAMVDGVGVDVEGKVIMISNLDVGNHTLTVTTVGDANHDSVTKTAIITVNKAKLQVLSDDSNATEGQKINLTVRVAGVNLVDEGSVAFFDGEHKIGQADVNKGIAKLPYVPSKAGEYSFLVVYSGTSRYLPSNSTIQLTVFEKTNDSNKTDSNSTFENNTSQTNSTDKNNDSSVVIPPLDGSSGDVPIEIRLPSDATGTVTLTINNETYVFTVTNGTANVGLPDLAGGDYPYTITYSGDVKYPSFSDGGVLKVNKTDSAGNVSDENSTEDISFPSLDGISTGGAVEIKLPDDATGTVTLTINNENHIFNVVNGVCNVSLTDLAGGDYPYTITYSGDVKYPSFSDEGILKVNKTDSSGNGGSGNSTGDVSGSSGNGGSGNSTGDVSDSSGNGGDVNSTGNKNDSGVELPSFDGISGDNLEIQLPDDATGTVTLTVNNDTYEFKVNKGVVNIKVPDNLGNGEHPFTIAYSGDDNYAPFSDTGSFKVNKDVKPTQNIKFVVSNSKVTYGAGSYFTIKVYGADGKLIDGAGITIKVNGKTFKTLTTKNGIAKFKVKQKPGKYKLTLNALGTSLNKTLTVKHLVTLKKVTVKKSAKKLILTAALAKVNKKYLKSKKVTFKFNGKKFTTKTNKKGVAKVTIKPSVLKKLKVGKKVTYQATYLKDTVKKTVKVRK